MWRIWELLLLPGRRMLRLQSKGLEAHTRIRWMYVPFTSLVVELTDIRDGKMQMSRGKEITLEGTREDQGSFDILFNDKVRRIMQYHLN